MNYKRIVVTGGRGYVGRILVEPLRTHGHTVTVLDRTGPAPVDILTDDLTPYLRDTHVLIHLAGHASPRISQREADENIASADRVIATLAQCPTVSHVILGSSINVYPYFDLYAAGSPITAATPRAPNMHWPPGAYGASKIEIEERFVAFAQTHQRSLTILRLGNVSQYRVPLVDCLRVHVPTLEGAIMLSRRDLISAVTRALAETGVTAHVCVSSPRMVGADIRRP